MPTTWGSNSYPPNRTSGYDIDQYCRYFTLKGNDLNFARTAGLWSVLVLDNGVVVAESSKHELLFSALNECYLITKGYPRHAIRPRPAE